jgi:hypothetical protein
MVIAIRDETSATANPCFTGWSREGYWRNGELLNRRQYQKTHSPIRGVVKSEQPISARQSKLTVKHISKTAQERLQATNKFWLDLPIFQDLRSLETL